MSDKPVMQSPPAPEGQPSGSEAQALEGSGKRKIGLAALAIALIHLLAKMGGYIQKKVLAHFFGTEVAADAATGMEKIFQLIYYIPEELLTHSLLPVFTRVRDEQGEAAAWRMASLTGTLQALLLVVVTIVGVLGAEGLVGLVLGRPSAQAMDYGAAVEKFELTVRLVRVAMLGLFCTSIGSLTYVLLNAYKRFVTPALGDVAQKIGIVIGTVVVCVGFSELGPLGYALGFILGGVFKLLTHLLALRGQLPLVRPGVDLKNPALRELGWLMVPLLAGSLVSKLRDALENRIAWSVPVDGTLASLDYARKIVWMPIQVVPYALGLALFPYLAEWAQQHDRRRVTDAFLGASRMMIFVFLPMTVGCVLLGEEVITVLYKSGRFREASVALTAGPFVVYSLGMVFYALEIIANQVYYAHRDTKTPFYLGLVGSALQVSLAYTCGLLLDGGNVGIAVGFAVAKGVKVILMWWALRPRLESFHLPDLGKLVLKTAGGCLAMALFIMAAKQAAPAVLDLNRVPHAALFLAGTGGLGALVFFGSCLLLKIDELQLLTTAVKRKLRKKG
ncbi:MAG: polysaccharide biosynthesis C-terminal domain-containing protein [Armatimonadetes bacterium]|nr:polysaccharide biosynthesis C-terminal domain-containing protein [Armatimonadota bacterium]